MVIVGAESISLGKSSMPKNKANHTETRRDDWETPQWLFDKLDKAFAFRVDLAASESSSKCNAYCDDFFAMTREDFKSYNNGYYWQWCNPPYGEKYGGLEKWLTEIPEKVQNAVVLIPAAPGNQWWHRVV